jgi:hypothetical protein
MRIQDCSVHVDVYAVHVALNPFVCLWDPVQESLFGGVPQLY